MSNWSGALRSLEYRSKCGPGRAPGSSREKFPGNSQVRSMVPQGRARRLYTNKDAKPQGFRGKGSSSEDLHCVDGMLEGLGRKAGPFRFLLRPIPLGALLRQVVGSVEEASSAARTPVPPPVERGAGTGGFSCGPPLGAPRNGLDRASHRVYWSKMRLGSAVLRRLCGGLVQNASEFDRFGAIRAKSGRLRRFLEQAPVAPPFPPETQTHFGTPDGARPPGRGRRASSAQ